MTQGDDGTTTIGPVIPVGRGDSVVSYHIYSADAVMSASSIRQLSRTVAAQSLQLAIARGERDEARAELAALEAAGPRRVVLHAPAWRCEWLGAALATVGVWAGMVRGRLRGWSRPTPVIDAIWE